MNEEQREESGQVSDAGALSPASSQVIDYTGSSEAVDLLGDKVTTSAATDIAPIAVAKSDASGQPIQEEMPLAMLNGKPVKDMPQDLYIPPDALEVFLEAFEGPLDLLLYLIRRQNLDILNIPIAHITEQYMEYVELMKSLNLELAAEYLVMASVLCEIKSRVLLPRPQSEEEEEVDPRADLIRRLQEYERFKKAAEDIDEIPRVGREIFLVSAESPELNLVRPQPEVGLKEVLLAFNDVLKRAQMYSHHHIQKETLTVREKMANVLAALGLTTL